VSDDRVVLPFSGQGLYQLGPFTASHICVEVLPQSLVGAFQTVRRVFVGWRRPLQSNFDRKNPDGYDGVVAPGGRDTWDIGSTYNTLVWLASDTGQNFSGWVIADTVPIVMSNKKGEIDDEVQVVTYTRSGIASGANFPPGVGASLVSVGAGKVLRLYTLSWNIAVPSNSPAGYYDMVLYGNVSNTGIDAIGMEVNANAAQTSPRSVIHFNGAAMGFEQGGDSIIAGEGLYLQNDFAPGPISFALTLVYSVAGL
jgi:hypothetical protein